MTRFPRIHFYLFLTFFLLATLAARAQEYRHALWDSLLKEHVDVHGMVDYGGFIKDSFRLNRYLQGLSLEGSGGTGNTNERLAWWLNAYNAFTVQLIIRNPTIKSIKDIGGKIPHVNSSWDIKFIKIGKRRYDLNSIEHGIIRKKFKDPRIHMALVCAAQSCPMLRREAYEGAEIDMQLDDQCRRFLKDLTKNVLEPGTVKISRIFEWYSGDFKNSGGVHAFLEKYSDVVQLHKIKIEYLPYNWELNGYF